MDPRLAGVIHPQIKGLKALMDANIAALNKIKEYESKEGPLAALVQELLDITRSYSPYLYGVLISAHRGIVEFGGSLGYTGRAGEVSISRGLIYIETGIVHPILGGSPDEYGYRIHETRNPWMERAARLHGPRLMAEYGNGLLIEFDHIYNLSGTPDLGTIDEQLAAL